MIGLNKTKRYVSITALRAVMFDLGYIEVVHGKICFELKNPSSSTLPSPLTLNYPEVAIDGTLHFQRDYVLDLMDRLSDGDGGNEDDIIIRFIRQLN